MLQVQQIAGNPSNFLAKRAELLDQVTLEQVRRAIDKMVDPEKLIVVAVGQPEGLTEQ
jgi:predicted Zn-dependent peptidase